MNYAAESLKKHAEWKGKIEVVSTVPVENKEDLSLLQDDLFNCDLLIIDDLGTELTNSFVASQLFSCLNERHLRKKATIISTNLSLQELRDRYSDRIFSSFSLSRNVSIHCQKPPCLKQSN